jgi:hypothetical protein
MCVKLWLFSVWLDILAWRFGRLSVQFKVTTFPVAVDSPSK